MGGEETELRRTAAEALRRYSRGDHDAGNDTRNPRPTLSKPDPKTLAAEILKSLNYRVGKDAAFATQHDWLTASIKVVRDRIIDHWIEVDQEPPTTRRPSASTICRWSS